MSESRTGSNHAPRLLLSLAAVLLFALASQAAPPEAPKEVATKRGKPVTVAVRVAAGAELGYTAAFGESSAYFEEMRSTGDTRRFMFWGESDGKYAVVFWTKGEVSGVVTTITVGTGAEPPVVDPPKNPPVVPPTAALYFLVVRPDGPSDPAFTRVMLLPEWAELTRAGHAFKDKTATEAKSLGIKFPANVALPFVAVLRVREGGKASDQLGVVPLPTTGAGIRDLPTAVK